jgi:uncharacterized protein YcbK (DUF882 family)
MIGTEPKMVKRHARRQFLGLAAAAATGLIAAPALALPRWPIRRALAFHNLHTGESLDAVYWADGRYLPEAAQRIEYLLRDFRNNKLHPIDPKLLDLLTTLRTRLNTSAPFLVISGYRSPATNAMLHRQSEGVATHSLHMVGQAIDIRLPDRALADVHREALAMKAGGVGYYPHSDFVHVDVGRVRRW